MNYQLIHLMDFLPIADWSARRGSCQAVPDCSGGKMAGSNGSLGLEIEQLKAKVDTMIIWA